MASAADIRAGRAFVELYVKSDRFMSGLTNMKRQIANAGRAAMDFGRQILMGVTLAAVPIGFATKRFADFSDQMKAVQAVTGSTGEVFERLNFQAKELGRTTSYTASQVASSMLNLARAGFAPAEIEAATPSMLALARATGTELAMAAEIAGNALRAFNLNASEMTRVADVLVAGANSSAQTLEDLGESMAYAAPIAHEYGMSIEQVTKAIGVLANMGIKGSMAGTSFRQTMLRMTDPVVQQKLQAIGVAAMDASGNMRPFGDVMIEIGKAMASMPGGKRLALARDLFDPRAAGAALKLARSDFPALNEAIDNARGTAGRTAVTMDSGLGGAFRRFMSAVEGVQIAIGEAISVWLGPLADAMANVATSFARAIKDNQGWINSTVAAIAVTAGLGASLLVVGASLRVAAFAFGGAVLPLVAFTKALGLLKVLAAVSLSPIGLLSAGVIALGVYWAATSETATSWFLTLQQGFAQVVQDGTEAFQSIAAAIQAGNIQGAITIALAFVRLEWQRAVNWAMEKWEVFRSFWGELTSGIAITFVNIAAKIKTVWADLVSFMQKAWESFMVSGFTEKLAGVMAPVLAKIQGVSVADARKTLREDMERGRAALPNRQAEIDSEAVKQKTEIEKDRASQESDIARQDDVARSARQRQIAEAEKALADAKAAFAMAQVQSQEPRKSTFSDAAKGGALPASAVGAMPAVSSITSAGTFSAYAAAAMGGGGSAAERTANATTRMVGQFARLLGTNVESLAELRALAKNMGYLP
jgi:TP901 family phage tail tape measure protein